MNSHIAEPSGDSLISFLLDETLRAPPEHTPGQADGALARGLRAIRTHLNMEAAFIGEFVEGSLVVRHRDFSRDSLLSTLNRSIPLDESLSLRVLDGRLPGFIQDIRALGRDRLPPLAEAGLRSYMCAPLQLSDGCSYGTLVCFGARPDPSLNDRDLAVLRLFPAWAGGIIERDLCRGIVGDSFRRKIEATLRTKDFRIFYQPVVDLVRRRVLGYEALSRFSSSPRQSPLSWFQEAVKAGLDQALELAVIEKALEDFHRFPLDSWLAFNISPATIGSGELPALFEGYPLDRVVLELTEHAAVDSYRDLDECLAPLRERGMRIAVDDAGAGYASFSHILRLQPDLIKIDQSIIRNIHRQPNQKALAVSLMQFAGTTGSDLVAEGVESAAELEELMRLGIDRGQGYLLSRPRPVNELFTPHIRPAVFRPIRPAELDF